MEQQNDTKNREYFAQRAAEELELARSAADEESAAAHRKLQRVFLEKASIGDRPTSVPDEIG